MVHWTHAAAYKHKIQSDIVEAIEFNTDTLLLIMHWCGEGYFKKVCTPKKCVWKVKIVDKFCTVKNGDFIVKHSKCIFEIYKPYEFKCNYKKIE